MKISALVTDAASIDRDITVAGYFEDFVPEGTAQLIRQFNLGNVLPLYSFSGKTKDIATIPCGDKAGLLILVGLGKKESFDYEALRVAFSSAISQSKPLQKDRIMLMAPGVLDANRELAELAIMARMTTYSFSRFKKQEDHDIGMVYIQSGSGDADSVDRGDIVGRAVNFGRDLANMPATGGTPTHFVEQAQTLKGLQIEVLERKDFLKLGMGGIEAVSRGSSEPAKMIIASYRNADSQPILLVGKGITFDSGGISIKPSENLANLKFDKSGASAVLGAMKAISELALKVNVVAILPLTENMPDGNSYKPGDIVKHYNGVTSEIISTDAEGRLVLADGLAYGIEKFSPRAVLDIATLTGAKTVALGLNYGAVMTNNTELLTRIMSAAERSWERLWQLPLAQEFKDQIKSDVADIKNTGGRPGGAETAGAFLSYFVGDVPWVHLDINGRSAPLGKAMRSYLPEGGSGFGVRLIVEFVKSFEEAGN